MDDPVGLAKLAMQRDRERRFISVEYILYAF